MSNYYEETIPLEINLDEYLKYYFDESLPLFDKLNNIIKKGQPFQKQALLSKLNLYQSNSLFKSLIQYIINDIETWDKETISLFPKSLYILLTQTSSIPLLSIIDNELFNMILRHIIKSITSTDEKISKEYIFYFEQIVFYYSSDNNIFPYIINDDIYDSIISLGKFGETELNRKISCYLCCAIIRILKNVKDDNVQKLYNRICFLFCECEKEIETQLSKDLEFLIPIFQKDILNNSDVLPAIYSYINNDSDHVIQTSIIISLVKNIYFIENNELAEKTFDKIKEIFEDEMNYEQDYKNNIFYEIINSLFKNYKLINNNIIKILFRDNILPKFIMKYKKDNIIIENFDKIFFIFNDMNNELEIWNIEENSEQNFNNINFDELFFSIYTYNINSFTNQKKNSIIVEKEKENNSKNINININILYNNLMKIVPFLSNLKNNKSAFDKINHLFNKDNLIYALKCYSESIKYVEKNCQRKLENNILYIFMTFLLKKNCEIYKPNINQNNTKPLSPIKKELTINTSSSNNNNENYYTRLFHNILNNIFSTFKESPKLFTNNIHLLLCDFFQRIIRKIHKYLKPTIPNIPNSTNNTLYINNNNNNKMKQIDKIYEDIFNNYLTKLVDEPQLGNYIKNEIIQIFPYLILYSKNRQIYFKYIKENIITSSTFFNRRYSIIFLNKCLQIYSFKMFNKIGLLDILLNLVNDNNNAISASIINLIYIYNRKIILGSNFTFQNICKNLSKINKINKDNKTVSIQNFDIEKNRYIKDILNLNLANNNINLNLKNNNLKKKNKNEENNNLDINKEQENKANEDFKDFDFWEKRENRLTIIENEIFGKDTNYGFYDFKNFVRSQSLSGHSQSPEINTIKRKTNYLNNLVSNKELIAIKGKEKTNKKVLTKDKYSSSSIIINNHNLHNIHNFNYNSKEKSNSKTFLPKIKQNRSNIISNKVMSKFNNIKNLNNFKIKQENQKLYEINQKNNNNNNLINNSMIIINDKSTIKTNNSNLLPFTQNGRGNKAAIKVRNSLPSFYPELFSNMNINNNNDNNGEDETKIKNNRICIETNKYKIEINPNNGKVKEGQINTIYKNKSNILNINPNLRNSKTFKLRRDNSLKDSFGRYNKMIMKLHGETDRFNLTNISFKEIK